MVNRFGGLSGEQKGGQVDRFGGQSGELKIGQGQAQQIQAQQLPARQAQIPSQSVQMQAEPGLQGRMQAQPGLQGQSGGMLGQMQNRQAQQRIGNEVRQMPAGSYYNRGPAEQQRQTQLAQDQITTQNR